MSKLANKVDSVELKYSPNLILTRFSERSIPINPEFTRVIGQNPPHMAGLTSTLTNTNQFVQMGRYGLVSVSGPKLFILYINDSRTDLQQILEINDKLEFGGV